MIGQGGAQRRVIGDWQDFSFSGKVMVSRSGDQHRLLFTAELEFDNCSELNYRDRFSVTHDNGSTTVCP